jgi:hypothetical protein
MWLRWHVTPHLRKSITPATSPPTSPSFDQYHDRRESAIYFYGSVVSVSPSEARIYYACGGLQAPNTTFLAVAVSHDGGATFTKPSLGLISYGGSTDNNLVFALPFDGWPNTGSCLDTKNPSGQYSACLSRHCQSLSNTCHTFRR